jgi:hypothetical protein
MGLECNSLNAHSDVGMLRAIEKSNPHQLVANNSDSKQTILTPRMYQEVLVWSLSEAIVDFVFYWEREYLDA